MLKIAWFIICMTFPVAVQAQLKIASPLRGEAGKDYFIDYFVDHDAREGELKDAYCGPKTYDGHTGTDFLLKNFAAMDSGVYVYAVADGKVYEVRDGNPDRNKHWNKTEKSNYVGIGSTGNYYISYHHMKKNSVLVKIGDTVKCGQPIGMVGSSGYSCYPHLHLEIRNKVNLIVDPFRGICKKDTSVLWAYPPTYDTLVYCIDNGFVAYIPGYDSLLENYGVTDTFHAKTDKKICYWAQMHGLKKSDELKYIWINPNNRVYNVHIDKWTNNWWYDYSWSWIDTPEKKGKWLLKYCINNKVIATRSFYIQ